MSRSRTLLPLAGVGLALVVGCGRASPPRGDVDVAWRPDARVAQPTESMLDQVPDLVIRPAQTPSLARLPRQIGIRYGRAAFSFSALGRLRVPDSTCGYGSWWHDEDYVLHTRSAVANPYTPIARFSVDREVPWGAVDRWLRTLETMRRPYDGIELMVEQAPRADALIAATIERVRTPPPRAALRLDVDGPSVVVTRATDQRLEFSLGSPYRPGPGLEHDNAIWTAVLRSLRERVATGTRFVVLAIDDRVPWAHVAQTFAVASTAGIDRVVIDRGADSYTLVLRTDPYDPVQEQADLDLAIGRPLGGSPWLPIAVGLAASALFARLTRTRVRPRYTPTR